MIIHLSNKKIIVADEAVQHTLELAEKAAKTASAVLISGPSGTGKELIARYIHEKSARAHRPFVSVNCAAIPEGLMESEFFGYERGAFTGAVQQRIGKFERANGGTFLLDEVSEMPLPLQAKLLRVLQENEIERLGGNETISVSARILATTNKDLSHLVRDKKFREDLYYRVNVICINCQALKGRPKAIRTLTETFLASAAESHDRSNVKLSGDALAKLIEHDWPGNIRELQNTVEKALWLSDGSTITAEHILLNPVSFEDPFDVGNLASIEKKHILKVLEDQQGSKKDTADKLGINVRTLRNKLKEYEVV